MTIRDDILELLRGEPAGLTDAQVAARLGIRHPQANMRCRGLVEEGLAARDPSGPGIVTRLDASAPLPTRPAPEATRPARGEWSWEGNVQAAVVTHLARSGWAVTRVADTAGREHGIDVTAERDGRRLLIEVKGWPSTTYARGDKVGQTKPTQPSLQAGHWFAAGLLAVLRTHPKDTSAELGLALPDTPRYRALLADVRWALERLAITVLLVTDSGEVHTWTS